MAIRLNGWQRLWVVVSMVWALVVGLIVFAAWPMPSSAEEHIRPADPNGWTPVPEGFYAALANLSGDTIIADRVAKTLLSATVPDAVRADAVRAFYLSANLDDLEKRLTPLALPKPVKAQLWDIKKEEPNPPELQIVSSEPLPFWEDHQLALRRITFAGGALALLLVPPIGLYALGWSASWVRRGFRE
jgi:hypothetical protein